MDDWLRDVFVHGVRYETLGWQPATCLARHRSQKYQLVATRHLIKTVNIQKAVLPYHE